jgi:hypothetical protein
LSFVAVAFAVAFLLSSRRDLLLSLSLSSSLSSPLPFCCHPSPKAEDLLLFLPLLLFLLLSLFLRCLYPPAAIPSSAEA